MAADAYAGHRGNDTPAVYNNPDNYCPADAAGYNPANFANQPGAAARANGYPRADGQSFSTSMAGAGLR